MKLTTRLLTLLAIIISFIPDSSADTSWTAQETALVKKCEEALSYRHFRAMIETAEQLRETSLRNQNREAADMALAFRLYGSIMAETDTMVDEMVQEATTVVTRSDYATKRAAAWLNAALAEYYISEIDYPKATGFALNALDGAKAMNLYDLSVIALSQLARIYNNKEDESGIRWARECLRMAENTNSPSSRYIATVNLGSYLLKEGDCQQAAALFDKADSIAHKADMKGEYSFLDTFRAEIFVRQKQYDQAERYFKKALLHNEATVPRDRWYARASYGNFLSSRHRYREALALFEEAEKISIGHKPYAQEYYIYLQKAESLEALGDYQSALQAYKTYNRLSSEAISIEKEREIANLEAGYKIAEQQGINSRQAMELMRKKRDFTLVLSICVLLVLGLLSFLIFYVRNLRYSRRMAEINLKAASSERQLRLQLAEALKQQGTSRQPDSEHLNATFDRLYLQLNRIMEEQYMYRDSSLTLEKLASTLSTNRTYLSKAIRLKTGMSYSSYISELRLNEAIRLLSTSTSSDIVKSVATAVGFYNQSTFYRLFKQKTGLSPAQFRQQACNLNRPGQQTTDREEENP